MGEIDLWLVCARDLSVGLRWRLTCTLIIIDIRILPQGRSGYALGMHKHRSRITCLTKRRATATACYNLFDVVVLLAMVIHGMLGLFG